MQGLGFRVYGQSLGLLAGNTGMEQTMESTLLFWAEGSGSLVGIEGKGRLDCCAGLSSRVHRTDALLHSARMISKFGF